MSGQPYYTLLAGLPPLRRFDEMERLPITRERLRKRLGMLDPEDAEVVEHAAEFLARQRQTAARTDEEMVGRYRRMQAHISHPDLRSFFEFSVDERTIMAALRRRRRGLPAPSPTERWGVGRYVRFIENNWDHPYFKLNAVYPWIPQAYNYLEQSQTPALERLLMNVLWDHVDRSVQPYDFSFRAVLVYIMKWDMVDRWLSYDVGKAETRFEELVAEVMNAH